MSNTLVVNCVPRGNRLGVVRDPATPAARPTLIARLRGEAVADVGVWTRDELPADEA